ncbi:MAG: cyclic nucleotide-binding domain-containing protein [Chloroflexota bacterium]
MKTFRRRGANRKIEELAAVPLFDHVPRRVLELIAAHVDEVEVKPDQVLVQEGKRNNAFWIIMAGEADMLIAGTKHRRLGPGQFFGATSMLDGKPAVATVVAQTPMRAYVASAAQFRALEGNETVALRLMHYAIERLREDLEAHAAAKDSAPATPAKAKRSRAKKT